jgi:hypothetical protein
MVKFPVLGGSYDPAFGGKQFMAKERRDGSRKKKADVRFVVTRPKSPDRLKLPDRLFHPGQSRVARSLRPNVEPKAAPLESYLPNLSFPTRIMSILIAGICVAAGLAMIVLGMRKGEWLLALLGPIGIWYGIGWVRVAIEGYLPGGRLRLNPWGTE